VVLLLHMASLHCIWATAAAYIRQFWQDAHLQRGTISASAWQAHAAHVMRSCWLQSQHTGYETKRYIERTERHAMLGKHDRFHNSST
jgi:hypothetical protein